MDLDAREIIRLLDLRPHPEGGFYRETWGTVKSDAGESSRLSFYLLLRKNEVSRWHRVFNDQTWDWYAGAPLELVLSEDEENQNTHLLGPDLDQDEEPQIIVPKFWWQKARTLGEWTLVQCNASAGIVFEGFNVSQPMFTPSFRLS